MGDLVSSIAMTYCASAAVITVAVIVFILSTFLCIFEFLGKNKQNILITSCCVSIILFVATGIVATILIDNDLYKLTNIVNQQYNVELSRTINTSDINNLYNKKVSEELIATVDSSDKRVYSVYLVDKDGEIGLYTKNEKGVYLPITSMSELEMNKA